MITVGVGGWIQLKAQHLYENHGGSLMRLYNDSLSTLLNSLSQNGNSDISEPGKSLKQDYVTANSPTHSSKPRNYWAKKENQLAYLSYLSSKLGFNHLSYESWYSVKSKHFTENGGESFLQRYNGCVYALLKEVFPEVEWLPWKFTVLPRSAVKDPDVLLRAVKFVERELKINSRNDWQRVSNSVVQELGLGRLFYRHGGIQSVVEKVYPTPGAESSPIIMHA